MSGAIVTLAQMSRDYGDHMDWGDGAGWVMFFVMTATALAIVVGVVWAIVFASRSANQGANRPGAAATAGPSARDVLDLRYARGEIDSAEYAERRSALG
jgi:putative membrane protein